MTVQRAREILQEEIQHLTDKEVKQLIERTSQSCDVLLDIIETSPDSLLTPVKKGVYHGLSD